MDAATIEIHPKIEIAVGTISIGRFYFYGENMAYQRIFSFTPPLFSDSAASPPIAPRFIDSSAELGKIINDPFFLMFSTVE